MRNGVLYISILTLLTLCSTAGRAQDIHFSQFYETAILRNPSLMGIYSEDYKIVGQYKEQWGSVGKGFRTGMFNAEFRFPINLGVNDFISVGFLGYSDNAGAINFRSVGLYPAVTINKSLEDAYGSYLSLGFTGGHVSRTIDVTKMTFDNQYQNGSFSAANGHGEHQLPDPKLSYWDLGTGVSLNSSPSSKTSFYLGVSAYHFTRPVTSFYADREHVQLQTRWNGNVGFNWFVDDEYSVMLHGNYMLQGPYQEIMAGAFFKWSRTDHRNVKSFGASAGVFYRLKDAVVPVVKIDWKGQSFAFSYDVNISTLKDVTRMRGGLEVSVSRVGFLSSGPDDKRLCPRF